MQRGLHAFRLGGSVCSSAKAPNPLLNPLHRSLRGFTRCPRRSFSAAPKRSGKAFFGAGFGELNQVDAFFKGKSPKDLAGYLTAIALFGVAMGYAAVPLYKVFCSVTGFGGTTQVGKLEDLTKYNTARDDGTELSTREVTVSFTADMSMRLPWRFWPCQKEIKVKVGEPALFFYKATNLSDKPLVGVATYNVVPSKAGQYFNKIQCFCFDEQRLRGQETLEMPVFFYLDPKMLDDPRMKGVNHIAMSYTFFKSEDEEGDVEPNDWDPTMSATASNSPSARAAAAATAAASAAAAATPAAHAPPTADSAPQPRRAAVAVAEGGNKLSALANLRRATGQQAGLSKQAALLQAARHDLTARPKSAADTRKMNM